MFGLDPALLGVIALAAIAAGAVCYALLFSRIETDKKTESRLTRVKAADADVGRAKVARDRVQEMSKRRKSVQDSLKELEKKQQENSRRIGKQSIKNKLVQAGLQISISRFYIFSSLFGLFIAFALLMLGLPLYAALGGGFVAGVGLPRWIVGFLVKRRQNKFLDEFPNALDVMVRSIKSGLPLNDAMRLIASDGQEPVKSEFRRVIESQQIGLSIPEACARMMQTMPLAEINFFAIVIALQSQAGGNLSEAIGNLSKVLRERRKMKAKIKAMSMEAKASAAIIGVLPFVVMILVYLTSPFYIMVLFTDPRGHLVLLGGGFWMGCGMYMMRQMVNFDI